MNAPQSGCPHCQSLSRVERHASLWWVCSVCGTPRIPGASGAELMALRAAKSAKTAAFVWRASALVLVMAALVTVLVAGIVAIAFHTAGLVLGLMGLSLGGGAFVAFKSARGRDNDARTKLEEGWTRAAEQLVEQRGAGMTATEVAMTLGLDPTLMERLLTHASAGDRIRIDVGDDAELRYAPTQVRIEEFDEPEQQQQRRMQR